MKASSHRGSSHVDRYLLNHKLGRNLGHGSFGTVQVAEHAPTGHKVAIKLLNLQKMEMEDKAMGEIKILRLFMHPHIIRLYEVIEKPTNVCVVMEYARSGELFDNISQKGRLQQAEARHFFQQISSGVEYCHRYIVVHRDLRPENLLLDYQNNVKVADFGLSNIMRDGHFLRESCGSPNHAASEVVAGKLYAGPEVDVWSCGVIPSALLCGTLAFDGEGFPDLLKKISEGACLLGTQALGKMSSLNIRMGRIYTLPCHLSPEARNLIPRTLMVDPMKRITIPEIRQHPWFQAQLPRCLALPPPTASQQPKKIDEEILQRAVEMGLQSQTLADRKWSLELQLLDMQRVQGPQFPFFELRAAF